LPSFWVKENKSAWQKKNANHFIKQRLVPNKYNFEYLLIKKKMCKDLGNIIIYNNTEEYILLLLSIMLLKYFYIFQKIIFRLRSEQKSLKILQTFHLHHMKQMMKSELGKRRQQKKNIIKWRKFKKIKQLKNQHGVQIPLKV
jgi:hypothetical protein